LSHPTAKATVVFTAAPVAKADWPAWRGANRDAIVPWLPDRLPTEPTILWRAPLASIGLGGIAATKKFVLVSDREFDDQFDCFRCLDAATGKEIWAHRYPAPGMLDYGNSPRATPLVSGGKCWLLGAHGNLSCVELATGRELWQIDVRSDFGLVEELKWGLCGSPLLADSKLILYPGGPQAALVALDPATGKALWKTPGAPPGYGSLNVAALGGKRQIVGHDATALNGWDLGTGKRLWSLKPPIAGDFNVPTPIVWRDRLIVSTENNGTRVFAFTADGLIVKEPVAVSDTISSDTHTPVVIGNRLFGVYQDLICLDLSAGLKPLWKNDDIVFAEHTSLIASKDRLLVSTSEGELLLVDAATDTFRLLGRMKALKDDGGLMSHPALVGKRLYLRGSSEIVCVNLDSATKKD
jgi:outer membrane protein assembly factor BamB